MRATRPQRSRTPVPGSLSDEDFDFIVRVEWVDHPGFAWIRYMESIQVVDLETLARWERALHRKLDPVLRRRGGERFPCVISIDNMSIRTILADEYGVMAHRLTSTYASRYARYGKPSTVRSIVAIEALKNEAPPNLFESRADAVAHVMSGN